MNTDTNIYTCQFYQWMGVEPSETATQVKSFYTVVNIGAVRNLFEKIIALSPENRKLVNKWGLYVDDQITIELLSWGVFKMNQYYSSSDTAAALTVKDFRALIFSPYLLGQHGCINKEKLAKSNQ